MDFMGRLTRKEIIFGFGIVYCLLMKSLTRTTSDLFIRNKELMNEAAMGQELCDHHRKEYEKSLNAPIWKLVLPF